MSAKTIHPLYTAMLSKWELGIHSYEGEDTIKDQGTVYLPATSGQIADGQGTLATSEGAVAYDAYKMRAIFPDIYKDAVEAAIGILHREPPVIELPTALKPMMESSTLLGESLEMLLRKINAEQLKTGRLGILGDIRKDTEGKVRPVIALYNALSIRNWDDASIKDDDVDIRLVVLDESCYRMNPSFEWEFKNSYRALALIGSDGKMADSGSYASVALDDNQDILGSEFVAPNISGTTLNHIPFVFINGKDLSPSPDNPPLDGLARSCLAIYRAEADYRQNLFMQGQDTLVRIGAADDSDTVRTGAGARIDCHIGGDAKYIGVSSNGLSEQRTALENDYSRAVQKSGQLVDSTSKAKESGDALRIRVSAQTATLPQLAKTGAAALEKVLRSLAEWYGANPDEVQVTPNLNFTEADMNGQTLVQIVQAKTLGAPLSEESLHEWLRDHGFTNLTYEEEIAKLSAEEPLPGANLVSPVDTPPKDKKVEDEE